MVGRDPTTAGSPTRPLDDSYYRVKDYWTKDRGWNWEELRIFLPMHVQSKLHQIMIREDDDAKYDICWGLTSNGCFSVKSAYVVAIEDMPNNHMGRWSIIWKLKVPKESKLSAG